MNYIYTVYCYISHISFNYFVEFWARVVRWKTWRRLYTIDISSIQLIQLIQSLIYSHKCNKEVSKQHFFFSSERRFSFRLIDRQWNWNQVLRQCERVNIRFCGEWHRSIWTSKLNSFAAAHRFFTQYELPWKLNGMTLCLTIENKSALYIIHWMWHYFTLYWSLNEFDVWNANQ